MRELIFGQIDPLVLLFVLSLTFALPRRRDALMCARRSTDLLPDADRYTTAKSSTQGDSLSHLYLYRYRGNPDIWIGASLILVTWAGRALPPWERGYVVRQGAWSLAG